MVYVRQLECFHSFHKTFIEHLLYDARPILVNRKVCALSGKKEVKERVIRSRKTTEPV